MHKNFIYINFNKWLEINSRRFSLKPFIEVVDSTSCIVAFQNVDFIKVIFYLDGAIEIWALKEANEKYPLPIEFSAILYEFDLRERLLHKGYLCEVCEPHIYTKDRSTIWEQHVYEPLLEWVIEYLIDGQYLCIYEDKSQSTSLAKIISNSELDSDSNLKYRIYCKPVIFQQSGV